MARPIFDSNAIRLNWMCQGEIAKRDEERSAIEVFEKSLRVIRKVVSTVKIPNIAEGKRTDTIFKPNTLIKGIIR